MMSLLLFIVGGVAGLFVFPAHIPFIENVPLFERPFRLGLDLQGGTHLVYQADITEIPAGDVEESMEGLRDVIERRVNVFGVAEPLIQVEQSGESQRLIVELAGIKDINEAIRLIGETPFLEFRTEREEPIDPEAESISADEFFVPTKLTGKFLERADVAFDSVSGQPHVTLRFNEEGAALFEEITEENIGRQVAIYLDGILVSAPVVQQKIAGGTAQITGNFTADEVRDMVRRLNSGALPVPITLISQQSVEASLGAESLVRNITAGIYGLIVVALFMIGWYRLPGLLAVLALLLYTVIVLTIFKLIPVTLTAAGVAGFILSIGIAVDANILIFERFKEEMARGRTIENALEEGFVRAWTSIRDSNVSSLITASILYWFGSSLIQGFALTLGIGILVSMFSAITITRTFLRAFSWNEGMMVRKLFGVK
ncbi:MAG: protein translocase subunit SecD [Candidatus Ryanbacteria bacterium CG10_big_fil_rev_8_21_14_0_10_43_42]|uniref:Protein translocase subunit SecD n=1 Tax=Candidatus Ryanbacteria bacterium CG10_big_fil_rev_8_21_14_0_10_43_42 TaxID=1974864 RepID=A0A2M8KYF8_9BACT|nr:MAG: protein translocase subunit SecD [Candidatus Ryanbacteria bacterium CG10_big_fil_rev_8_21_14_0_10_43_42]